MFTPALKNKTIHKWTTTGNSVQLEDDLVAVEEPLEIVLVYNSGNDVVEEPLTLTMRTPGSDEDLAVGFLFSEGIINSFKDIEHVKYCVKTKEARQNKLRITLKKTISINTKTLQRNFASTSSCGVCGKQMLEHICTSFSKIEHQEVFPASNLMKLPSKLNFGQLLFKHTGGIHACGLFASDGSLISLKEDIGRHNALDKVIGAQIIKDSSFSETIVVLSGRVGYEMAQKAAKAKIPIIVAIGAPTSLAIEIAEEAGVCLIGFVKKNSFNCYSHPKYINFEK